MELDGASVTVWRNSGKGACMSPKDTINWLSRATRLPNDVVHALVKHVIEDLGGRVLYLNLLQPSRVEAAIAGCYGLSRGAVHLFSVSFMQMLHHMVDLDNKRK